MTRVQGPIHCILFFIGSLLIPSLSHTEIWADILQIVCQRDDFNQLSGFISELGGNKTGAHVTSMTTSLRKI